MRFERVAASRGMPPNNRVEFTHCAPDSQRRWAFARGSFAVSGQEPNRRVNGYQTPYRAFN